MKLIRDGFKVEWTPMLQELTDRDSVELVINLEQYEDCAFAECPKCGFDLMEEYNHKFCGNCGQRLNWE